MTDPKTPPEEKPQAPAPSAAATGAVGDRQEPVARPYGNPQPADFRQMPTVDEIHSRLPDDIPGAGETREQYEARQKDDEKAQMHPARLPGLHRESVGGPLIADEKNDPGINLNVIS